MVTGKESPSPGGAGEGGVAQAQVWWHMCLLWLVRFGRDMGGFSVLDAKQLHHDDYDYDGI